MNTLPQELLDIIADNLSLRDLKVYCRLNKKASRYCIHNRGRILKRLETFKSVCSNSEDLDDYFDNLYTDFSFLFKSKKLFLEQVFDVLGPQLIEFLEEYPINTNTKILIQFGEFIAKNWRTYIKLDPETVLLWHVYTLKKLPKFLELKKVFDFVPISLIKNILRDSNFFNNGNDDIQNKIFQFIILNYVKTGRLGSNYKY